MSEKNRTRTHRVQVRLNDEEYEFFRYNLALTGLTAEAYLRKLLSGKTPKVREITKFEENITAHLYAIGNNLNQIARQAHTLKVIHAERYTENVKNFERLMSAYLKQR